jgi:hypothetical protein
MEVAGETTISLGDVLGPFHPYEEVEGEEELNGCNEGHSENDGVEAKIDVIRDIVAVEEPRVLVVPEEEPIVPLAPHAYSKVGKIPPGTYSREALRGKSEAIPLLKRPRPRQVPIRERTMNVNVACPVVQEVVRDCAENAKGIPKRIKFKE